MPFSRLLMIAASSKRSITGYGGDKVVMEELESGKWCFFLIK
jgi:hypothetical protein